MAAIFSGGFRDNLFRKLYRSKVNDGFKSATRNMTKAVVKYDPTQALLSGSLARPSMKKTFIRLAKNAHPVRLLEKAGARRLAIATGIIGVAGIGALKGRQGASLKVGKTKIEAGEEQSWKKEPGYRTGFVRIGGRVTKEGHPNPIAYAGGEYKTEVAKTHVNAHREGSRAVKIGAGLNTKKVNFTVGHDLKWKRVVPLQRLSVEKQRSLLKKHQHKYT